MRRQLWFLMVLMLGLGGCQTSHSLKPAEVDYQQRLPAISVSVMGAIPAGLIRDELRRRGTFEQVQPGFSADGYNVIVMANSDYFGWQNIPMGLLSAMTLFIVPGRTTWDSQVMFHVSRGDQEVAKYRVSNQTRSWRGWANTDGGQYQHVRRITDDFIAQMLQDPQFKAQAPVALDSH
ncbi:hypothetical protein QF008_000724 [Pseudomonas protegens]|jgi:hypothetical protein|uniref:hypothetical protein n=1 Tax=Pseudomonas protegens TaxID=380021 RepID=UPI000F48D310|nr:hypothetical protein [Pseudomonas protegens]MDT3418993.1 hypothetical protein [Pseudomonas protegens]ROM21535.1 hypothetical protein BK644_27235 [Pseudomonas protegens]